MILKKVSKTIL